MFFFLRSALLFCFFINICDLLFLSSISFLRARFRMKAEILNSSSPRCTHCMFFLAGGEVILYCCFTYPWPLCGLLCPRNMEKAHKWLLAGWFVEIRSGGENVDKVIFLLENWWFTQMLIGLGLSSQSCWLFIGSISIRDLEEIQIYTETFSW
jgi:hypothetical protein